MAELRRVPRYAVALVLLGGAMWVFSGVVYGAQVAACSSCASVVLPPGVDSSSYSAAALRNLAWDDLYADMYIATVGLLVIAIGTSAFRRGHRWAWYSMVVFVLAAALTSLLDQLSWGGWHTFLFLGMVPLLGVILSAKSFFAGDPKPDTLAR